MQTITYASSSLRGKLWSSGRGGQEGTAGATPDGSEGGPSSSPGPARPGPATCLDKGTFPATAVQRGSQDRGGSTARGHDDNMLQPTYRQVLGAEGEARGVYRGDRSHRHSAPVTSPSAVGPLGQGDSEALISCSSRKCPVMARDRATWCSDTDVTPATLPAAAGGQAEWRHIQRTTRASWAGAVPPHSRPGRRPHGSAFRSLGSQWTGGRAAFSTSPACAQPARPGATLRACYRGTEGRSVLRPPAWRSSKERPRRRSGREGTMAAPGRSA